MRVTYRKENIEDDKVIKVYERDSFFELFRIEVADSYVEAAPKKYRYVHSAMDRNIDYHYIWWLTPIAKVVYGFCNQRNFKIWISNYFPRHLFRRVGEGEAYDLPFIGYKYGYGRLKVSINLYPITIAFIIHT